MSKENGGPAFPCNFDSGPKLDNQEGLSLRDYFAAKAMAALISLGEGYQEKAVAESSYLMADVMLAERSKP